LAVASGETGSGEPGLSQPSTQFGDGRQTNGQVTSPDQAVSNHDSIGLHPALNRIELRGVDPYVVADLNDVTERRRREPAHELVPIVELEEQTSAGAEDPPILREHLPVALVIEVPERGGPRDHRVKRPINGEITKVTDAVLGHGVLGLGHVDEQLGRVDADDPHASLSQATADTSVTARGIEDGATGFQTEEPDDVLGVTLVLLVGLLIGEEVEVVLTEDFLEVEPHDAIFLYGTRTPAAVVRAVVHTLRALGGLIATFQRGVPPRPERCPTPTSGQPSPVQISTADFKVRVVAGELRRRGATVENPATVALGISVDEIERAKPGIDPLAPYQRRVYPLLDLGLRRSDCQRIIAEAGLPVPGRSACWFCLIWNLAFVACGAMISVPWKKFPLVGVHEHGRRWLQFTANIGRAPNTVLAYGRALEDHLRFCSLVGADPLLVKADVVAAWIGDLLERPVANATIQLRVVAVRSFYDFLVEDGLRERNPVRRGQSGRRGGRARQGLVRRVDQAPWIPNESDWQLVLSAALVEPLRNRLMVALAYDGALRREELVGLQVGDFEPAYSLIRLRAETTKSKRSREVSYGTATSRLFGAYLAERRQIVGRAAGPLLVSVSRRNHGAALGSASWSKIVTGIAARAGVGRFTTHTFRHLRLTDLARAGWTIDQIAQYAGHRNLTTTLRYIHLSGRELAARLHRASASIQADRERLLSTLAVTA
jgi:integrase/recombinase XerD